MRDCKLKLSYYVTQLVEKDKPAVMRDLLDQPE